MDGYRGSGAVGEPTDKCRCLNIISAPLSIPCFQTAEDDFASKSASKVSQIATMFQGGGAPDDPAPQTPIKTTNSFQDKEAAGPPIQASVVRTESHVARFNTARALFEKMSEQKSAEGSSRASMAASGPHSKLVPQEGAPRSQGAAAGGGASLSPAPSTAGTNSNRGGQSRSLSPASSLLGHIHSNGHAAPARGASEISTISSSLPSSMSSPPVSTAAAAPCPSANSSIYSPSPPPSSHLMTDSSDQDLVRLKKSAGSDRRGESHSSKAPPSRSTVDGVPHPKGPKPGIALKPMKSAKPDLMDKLSAHQQHQELVQRHKNWFQSFSKAKSPSTSPVKTEEGGVPSAIPSNLDSGKVSSRGSKTGGENSSNLLMKCEAEASEMAKKSQMGSKHHNRSSDKLQNDASSSQSGLQSDRRKDKVHIISGRSGTQHGNENETKTPPTISDREPRFEEISTLPSSWCPPKQYNQPKLHPSSEEFNTKALKDSSNALQTESAKNDPSEVARKHVPVSSRGPEPHQSTRGVLAPLEKQATDVLVTENVHLKESSAAKEPSVPSFGATHNNREIPSTSEGVVLRRPVVQTNRTHEEFNHRLKESISDGNVLRHSFHREPETGKTDHERASIRSNLSFESEPEKRLKEWERKRRDRERFSLEVKLGSKYPKNEDVPEVHSSCEMRRDSYDSLERSEKICRIIPAGSVNVITENRAKAKPSNDEVIWVKREDASSSRHHREVKNYSKMTSSGSFNGLDEPTHYRDGDNKEYKGYEHTSYSLDRQSKWERDRKRQDLLDKQSQEELRIRLEEEQVKKRQLERLEETKESHLASYSTRSGKRDSTKSTDRDHTNIRHSTDSLRSEKGRKNRDRANEEQKDDPQEQMHRELSKKMEAHKEQIEYQRRQEYERQKQYELEKQRQEELAKKRKEELDKKRIEEVARKRQEEVVRRRHEELEKRKQEELERKRQKDLERKRHEDLERQRQEELERKRQQELERRRQEELERKRMEEMERQRKEEIEMKRQEELEKRRQEEIEKRRQEEIEKRRQEEIEKRRQEEIEKRRQEEIEKRRQEEIEKRRQEEIEIKRQEELEKRRREEIERKQQEELEKQQQEESERRQQKELEIQRLEELERQQQVEQQRQKQEELDRQSAEETAKVQTVDSISNIEKTFEDNEDICDETQEISRIYEEKRRIASQKWEEEERVRRERDRQEILKTKQRIAELKREREEIRRQQAFRMQQLLDGQTPQDVPLDEASPDRATERRESEGALCIALDNLVSGKPMAEQQPVDNGGDGSSPQRRDSQGSAEEIVYDHTVLSAQHKFEFCVSPHGGGETASHKEDELETVSSDTLQYQQGGFSQSTVSSSEYDPLPPPIPPHNVDPATLVHPRIEELEELPSPIVLVSHDEPSVMTPEEEQRLLSHKENRSILSDTEAKEAVSILTQSSEDLTAPPPDYLSSTREMDAPSDMQPDSLDGNVASCVVQNEPEEQICPIRPEETPKDEFEDSFVPRVKEILVEDGVHYLEDGHYWVEIPGLSEEDDDDFPSTVPYHKHTKLKFSKDPIQQYTTHSVSEYDRKNEDVDPVAASAEYELEKRVEKMDVFPVEIEKGDGGLGLSIIGMGVGADAGVEKLGIFVKTITPGGATDNDGKINVNDQIIEVDDQSLVGVTQAFAASVLKNTSGHVRFLVGREKDPENSEVAMLIRQSLMADMEREERRRALGGPNYEPHDGLFESLSSASNGSPADDTCRNNFSSHYDEVTGEDELGSCPGSPRMGSPPPEAFNHNVEAPDMGHSNEVLILRHQLQEVQQRNDMFEEEIGLLRAKITGLEGAVGEKLELSKNLQETSSRLKEVEDHFQSKQAEIATYQDMLEQSQGQYIILEKKYYKAKKIIKEYQSRERDFLHREEYHINQLEEKDSHYNSLVKALKDRVIQLEGDLMKAQQQAGLPVRVPPDTVSTALKEVNQISLTQMEPLRKPSHLSCLEDELSDNEGGEGLTSEESKSSTVERKVPLKEELDVAVPPHQLLDVSASKAKSELASRGGLANRQLPSLKKTGSQGSASSFDRSVDESNETITENLSDGPSMSSPTATSNSVTTINSVKLSSHTASSQTASHSTVTQEVFHQQNYHSESSSHTSPLHSPTSSHPSSISSMEQPVHLGVRQPPPYQPPPYQPPPTAPLSHRPLSTSGQDWSSTSISGGHNRSSESGGGLKSEVPYRHTPPIARVQPVNRVDVSVESSSSTAYQRNQQHLQQIQQQQQQQTLAEQLKALLSEREAFAEIPRGEMDPRDGGSPMKKSPSSLMEDVRQAVIQADVSLGKKPLISGPYQLASTAQVVSTGQLLHRSSSPQKQSGGSFPQRISRDSGSWSPKSGRSVSSHSPAAHGTASGVVLLSQRPLDPSLPPYHRNGENVVVSPEGNQVVGASFAPIEEGAAHGPLYESRSCSAQALDRSNASEYPREHVAVFDWTPEQVAQWLKMQGFENCVPKFLQSGISGPRLINLDAKDLKNLNLTQEEKTKIKKKVRDLRLSVEKERKQVEKEKKEREKLQKKAEKLAEKAEKKKK